MLTGKRAVAADPAVTRAVIHAAPDPALGRIHARGREYVVIAFGLRFRAPAMRQFAAAGAVRGGAAGMPGLDAIGAPHGLSPCAGVRAIVKGPRTPADRRSAAPIAFLSLSAGGSLMPAVACSAPRAA